jgi:hypothetical protein
MALDISHTFFPLFLSFCDHFNELNGLCYFECLEALSLIMGILKEGISHIFLNYERCTWCRAIVAGSQCGFFFMIFFLFYFFGFVSYDSIYIVIACSGVFAIQLIEIELSRWIA